MQQLLGDVLMSDTFYISWTNLSSIELKEMKEQRQIQKAKAAKERLPGRLRKFKMRSIHSTKLMLMDGSS